jgi:hypothetical protein
MVSSARKLLVRELLIARLVVVVVEVATGGVRSPVLELVLKRVLRLDDMAE